MYKKFIQISLTLLFTGCYDGNVYCFHLKTGQIIWNHQTGNIIKCSAILCTLKETIFVGSYDCYVYCLSVKVYVHFSSSKLHEMIIINIKISTTGRV